MDSNLKIKWDKFFCPACHAPTGKSNCEDLETETVKSHEDNTIQPASIPLTQTSLFSKACFYKRHNLWIVHINKVITEELLQYLKNRNLHGIDSIKINRTHAFLICIADLFDEAKVKKEFNLLLQNYFKSKFVNPAGSEIKYSSDDPIGIILPNGEKFLARNPNEVTQINILLDEFPDSKPIFRKE